MAVTGDGVRLPLGAPRVQALVRAVLRAEGVSNALVSVAFVTPRAIARLNRKHLSRRGSTDVITFAFDRVGRRTPLIGDIYIAPDVARRNARRHGASVRDEVARVVVHGVLHMTGYDHPEGERAHSPMWRRQEALLARFAGGHS